MIRPVRLPKAPPQEQPERPRPAARPEAPADPDHDDEHDHGDDRQHPRVAGADRECRPGVADEVQPQERPDEVPRLLVAERADRPPLGHLVQEICDDGDRREQQEQPPAPCRRRSLHGGRLRGGLRIRVARRFRGGMRRVGRVDRVALCRGSGDQRCSCPSCTRGTESLGAPPAAASCRSSCRTTRRSHRSRWRAA